MSNVVFVMGTCALLLLYIYFSSSAKIVHQLPTPDSGVKYVGTVTATLEPGIDNLQQSIVSASQGIPWITIHNHTDSELHLKDVELYIPPHCSVKFSGRYSRGVMYGTIFTATSGLYPSYQVQSPITDLHFSI